MPHPPIPVKRDEPVLAEQGPRGVHFVRPTDERRSVGGQPGRHGASAQRWEVARQIGVADLEQLHGLGDVLEVVPSEAAKSHERVEPRYREVAHERGRDDLPAVRNGLHPLGLMDAEPEKVLAGRADLTGVDAHAHANRGGVGPRRARRARAARRPRMAMAPRAVGNVTKKLSPSVPCSTPPCAAIATRMSAR